MRQGVVQACRAIAAAACVAAVLWIASAGCERKRDPDLKTQLAEQEAAATRASAPAPKPAVELGDPLGPYLKRAEAGEVSAMITLGRMYESKGGAESLKEARKWYEKAAATGNEDAQMSLKMLDAALAAQQAKEQPTSAPALSSPFARSTPPLGESAPAPAPTRPTAAAGGIPVANAPATANAVATTGPARDLSKMGWKEVVGSIDTSDFVTVANPEWKGKDGKNDARFVGLTTASDKRLTVAASGLTGDDVREVSIVLRVRNQQNLADNTRLTQAQTVCNAVTRGNFMEGELAELVKTYLTTQKKSDPFFRAGWRITVSGSAGEGMRDPKDYLGELVLIEMKK